MFESISRLLKHSAVYGIGHIITRSMGFLLLPLHTNVFPPDEFGVAGLLFSYIAIAMIFYTFGMDSAFFRFYILEDNPVSRKRVFSTTYAMILVIGFCMTAGLLFFNSLTAGFLFSPEAHNLDIDLNMLIKLAAGIMLFDGLSVLPFLTLRADEKPVLFTFYKLINILINVLGNILFLIVLDFGVEGIFTANLCAAFLTFVILLPITWRNLVFSVSRKVFREVLLFSLPNVPATISIVLMDTVDRVFLEKLASVEQVGLYNAGAKLGMFMSLFVAAFRFAWQPFFLSTTKQENAREIFSKVLTYVLLSCLSVYLVLCLFIDDIVRIPFFGYSIIEAKYWQSTIVVPVIMLAYVFYAAYLNFIIGIYLEKKTRYLAYITLLGLTVNLIFLYTLIPALGMMGAAWARLASYIVMAVALYYAGRRLYKVNYEWSRILKLFLITAIFYYTGMETGIGQIFWGKVVLILVFPVVLTLTGFLKRNELLRMRSLFFGILPDSGKSK
jgi:O-antigen/teichoic acid export membrane protein